jgi:hypothetical protein
MLETPQMVSIKPLDSITAKWAQVTPERAPFYEAGIASPAKDWQAGALQGQAAYEAAMRNPAILKQREAKIKVAGTEKWSRKAKAVGPSRFREGVPAAKDDYNKGFSTYHGVIASLALPEKGARGDPKNYARVAAVGNALNKKRMGSA